MMNDVLETLSKEEKTKYNARLDWEKDIRGD